MIYILAGEFCVPVRKRRFPQGETPVSPVGNFGFPGRKLRFPRIKRLVSSGETDCLLQGDARRLGGLTASPDEEVELSGLGYMVQVVIIEAQQLRSNLEGNGLAFACTKEYLFKAFQLAYGAGDASYKVADV